MCDDDFVLNKLFFMLPDMGAELPEVRGITWTWLAPSLGPGYTFIMTTRDPDPDPSGASPAGWSAEAADWLTFTVVAVITVTHRQSVGDVNGGLQSVDLDSKCCVHRHQQTPQWTFHYFNSS